MDVHSAKLQWLDTGTLSAVQGKARGGTVLVIWGVRCSYKDLFKIHFEQHFCFSPYFVKAKILFDFFVCLAKTGY